MKLCAIVITYHPDTDELLGNTLAYAGGVDALIVWDNTPGGSGVRMDLGGADAKTLYMGDGTNHYIAFPLNRAVEWARERGYTHLLTMDQDSLFEPGSFATYRALVEEKAVKDKAIAVYSVNLNHQFGERPHTYFKGMRTSITSGSIYDLEALAQTDGFREDFGIDAVDTEMNLKLGRLGYRTVVCLKAHMKHRMGNKTRTAWGFRTDNYPAVRVYHIIRNHIIIWREYPRKYKDKYKFLRKHIILRVFRVILAERSKREKLRAIWWGVVDGLRSTPSRYM